MTEANLPRKIDVSKIIEGLILGSLITIGIFFAITVYDQDQNKFDLEESAGAAFSLNSITVATAVILLLAMNLIRAWRYQIMIGTTEPDSTSSTNFKKLFTITSIRSAVVDIFPFRLGEVLFCQQLNKHLILPYTSGISLIVLSSALDLLTLVISLIGVSLIFATSINPIIVILGIVILLILIFTAVLCGLRIRRLLDIIQEKFSNHTFKKIIQFIRDMLSSIEMILKGKETTKLLALSALIRIIKFLFLLVIYLSVIEISGSTEQSTSSVFTHLMTLVAAESGGALPIPTFLGFGPWELSGAISTQSIESVAALFATNIHSKLLGYSLALLMSIYLVFGRTFKRSR